jgi:hypothetical protein
MAICLRAEARRAAAAQVRAGTWADSSCSAASAEASEFEKAPSASWIDPLCTRLYSRFGSNSSAFPYACHGHHTTIKPRHGT